MFDRHRWKTAQQNTSKLSSTAREREYRDSFPECKDD